MIHGNDLCSVSGKQKAYTWMIIPVSRLSVTPIYKPFRPFESGTTLLGGLAKRGYSLLN